ncbi:MAG: hypothetical protein QGH82_04235, partial [Candidatus Woesearchaeota archaeon]|nr:hypothetical protein [Candidatus Woesearchaeota archaeon]
MNQISMGIWNFSVIKKQVKKSETWLFLIKTLKSPFSMGIVAQKGFPREGESKVLIKTRKSRFSMGIVAHKGFPRVGMQVSQGELGVAYMLWFLNADEGVARSCFISTVAILAQGTISWLATRSP